MLFRPDTADLRIIGTNVGRVLLGVGAVMLVPAVVGLALGEYNEAASFVIAACLAGCVGLLAEMQLGTRRHAQWQHGMVIAAVSWLLVPVFGALPLHMSGHYTTFLDAYFDAMSGFATSALTVINDLDHLSRSVNLWRHLMQFLGGQGAILVTLSLFAAGGGPPGMYVGEAREERLVPNLVRTLRMVLRVAVVYAVLGTAALFAALVVAGLTPSQAVFHAITLFMAAFDTGGFTPTSGGIWLYHSPAVELVLVVLMVAGGLSVVLHSRLWQAQLGELGRNIETRLLIVVVPLLYTAAAIGLLRADTYDSVAAIVRRGLFQVVSAQTGTGFSSVPHRLFANDWGVLAPAALILAMAIGPMAGSAGGGIKLIRLGVVAKSIAEQVKRLTLPSSAVTVASYHSGGHRTLRGNVVRAAMTIVVLYVALYLLGAVAGLLYDYPLDLALFESTSAAATAGLSVGIVGPSMPVPLQLVYILQMWLGRLEFVAVLAFFGFVLAAFRGRL